MKTKIVLLAVMIGIIFAAPASWAVDPNVNTQSANARSNGTDGKPGFDPCPSGTPTNNVCGGAVSPGALLEPGVGGTLELFTKLGPGAITDNMFGVIEAVDQNPGICGDEGGGSTTIGIPAGPTSADARLNCGNVRFDPTTQGQTNLTGNNTLTAGIAVNMNNSLVADFCAVSPATDCDAGAGQVEAAHTGFNLLNNFTWTGINATTANVVSSQTMEQTTALKTSGIGTRLAPGSGDQVVKITNDFTTVSSNNPSAGGNPLVTWTQEIQDPDQSGVGTGKFSQTIAGSFTYNTGGNFPTVQYPDGQSLTNQSIASANLP